MLSTCLMGQTGPPRREPARRIPCTIWTGKPNHRNGPERRSKSGARIGPDRAGLWFAFKRPRSPKHRGFAGFSGALDERCSGSLCAGRLGGGGWNQGRTRPWGRCPDLQGEYREFFPKSGLAGGDGAEIPVPIRRVSEKFPAARNRESIRASRNRFRGAQRTLRELGTKRLGNSSCVPATAAEYHSDK